MNTSALTCALMRAAPEATWFGQILTLISARDPSGC
uniref:Uncharacterized protein n=1 Tax=Musa acuminata subsp. malaccensis TaxID=214687 RepID=A0A804I8G5_MUSAM